MKLSKKIVILFMTISLVTVTLYMISMGFVSKYLYSGEVTRISGIASGCINRVNGEVSKVIGKGNDYTSLLSSADTYNEKLNETNALEELGIINKFRNDNIDFKVVLDSNFNEKEKFESKDLSDRSKSEYSILLNKIKTIIKEKKDVKKGYITGKEGLYIFSYNKKYNSSDYVVIIDSFDDGFIENVSKDMNRNVALLKEIDATGEVEDSKLNSGENIKLVTNETDVNAYYKIECVDGENYYIKVSEPLVVKESHKLNMFIISVIFISINIIINLILIVLMKNIVVKRVERISEGINRIKEHKDLKERLELDNSSDEISKLTSDINEMFDALETSNNLFMENEEKSIKLLEGLDNGYAYFGEIMDEEGNVVDANLLDVNASMSRILNIPKKNLYRMTFKEIFFDKINDEEFIRDILSSGKRDGETLSKNCIALGNNNWASIAVYPIENHHFAMLLTDITENRRNEDEMRYLGNYDVLTGLQNRYSLYNYMAQLKEDGEVFSIFFIDLDNFKSLNDSLGHNSGDEVLCQAAFTLQNLGQDIEVGRLGGDEFLLVKKGELSKTDAENLGNKILRKLNKTFEYKNFNYELKASIGASSFPNHTTDIETLIRYADIAMYKSKNSGGNNIEVFNEEMLEDILIEGLLKKAIDNKEFVVNFQPIYSVNKKKIIGAEALVRWVRDGRVIYPDKFIHIAKRTGDIYEIDNYVLREACIFCKEKRKEGFKDFQVSVNASYRFLKQHKFIDKLKNVLEEVGLEPDGLKLEITEDEVLDDAKRILELLKEIKALGVLIALDDFGVGYSSFSYIKILPIDTIKIDRSLLSKIENDRKTVAIIETLIKLAHTLELDVIAEGVEMQDQLELLKSLNCDKIQGYFISKPIDREEFENLLEKHN